MGRTVTLDEDPEVPRGLDPSQTDNWRVLLAIADGLGEGTRARAAAVAFAGQRYNRSPGVELLRDLAALYNERNLDRMTSAEMVARLTQSDDSPWNDWRGQRGDLQPHKLTQSETARLLSRFRIKPRSIRQKGRAETHKGYYRAQFEEA
jgi:hypothetical protein